MGQPDAGVGRLGDVPHQVELGVHSRSAVELVGSGVGVPVGGGHEPLVVELLVGEDVPDGLELVAQLGVLQVDGDVVELRGERALVHPCGILRVVEEHFHHPRGLVVARVEGVEAVERVGRAHHRGVGTGVEVVHVVHVMVGGVAREAELGVHGGELQQLVLHREDAADDHRGARVDVGVAGKHLGEPLIHAPRYAPVLLRAELRQLPLAAHSLRAHRPCEGQHLLAPGGELAQGVGPGEREEGLVERVLADEPARPVAPVVADVERRVALGRGRELPRGHGIVAVVVGRQVGVGLDLLPRPLGVEPHEREGKEGKQKNVFSHYIRFWFTVSKAIVCYI